MTSREIGKLTLRLYRERYGYDARPDRQEIIAKEGVSCKVHNVFYTYDHDLIEARAVQRGPQGCLWERGQGSSQQV